MKEYEGVGPRMFIFFFLDDFLKWRQGFLIKSKARGQCHLIDFYDKGNLFGVSPPFLFRLPSLGSMTFQPAFFSSFCPLSLFFGIFHFFIPPPKKKNSRLSSAHLFNTSQCISFAKTEQLSALCTDYVFLPFLKFTYYFSLKILRLFYNSKQQIVQDDWMYVQKGQ